MEPQQQSHSQRKASKIKSSLPRMETRQIRTYQYQQQSQSITGVVMDLPGGRGRKNAKIVAIIDIGLSILAMMIGMFAAFDVFRIIFESQCPLKTLEAFSDYTRRKFEHETQKDALYIFALFFFILFISNCAAVFFAWKLLTATDLTMTVSNALEKVQLWTYYQIFLVMLSFIGGVVGVLFFLKLEGAGGIHFGHFLGFVPRIVFIFVVMKYVNELRTGNEMRAGNIDGVQQNAQGQQGEPTPSTNMQHQTLEQFQPVMMIGGQGQPGIMVAPRGANIHNAKNVAIIDIIVSIFAVVIGIAGLVAVVKIIILAHCDPELGIGVGVYPLLAIFCVVLVIGNCGEVFIAWSLMSATDLKTPRMEALRIAETWFFLNIFLVTFSVVCGGWGTDLDGSGQINIAHLLPFVIRIVFMYFVSGWMDELRAVKDECYQQQAQQQPTTALSAAAVETTPITTK